jgi:hypothetical protein
MPLFGVLEAAGPEERPFEDFAADVLAARDRVTPVIGDAQTPFFGALVGERTLMPGPDAHLAVTRWPSDSQTADPPAPHRPAARGIHHPLPSPPPHALRKAVHE